MRHLETKQKKNRNPKIENLNKTEIKKKKKKKSQSQSLPVKNSENHSNETQITQHNKVFSLSRDRK